MNTSKNISIDKVINSGICNGCGTCYSICPESAIKIVPDFQKGIFTAVNDNEKCIECGKCVKVCHSYETVLNGKFLNADPVGQYQNIYYGYSKDENLRFNASSGGIISAILKYLMEKKKISGFVLVRPTKSSPFIHEAFISNDILDIKKYAGTRYIPIPVNKILRELIHMEGLFVVIGTPCQIHSITLLEREEPKLKKKIFIKISVFCGGTPNLNAYPYYLQQHRIKENSISSIYRGGGWPGHNIFHTNTGERILIARRPEKFLHKIYHTLAFFPIFTVKRCLICNDRFGAFSDISVGDAWLDRFKDDTRGTSLIITRTETADNLIATMVKDNFIETGSISKRELIESQIIFLEYYKNFSKTMSIIMGKNLTRQYHFDETYKGDLIWPLKFMLILFGWKLSQRKYLWKVLFIYGMFFQIVWTTLSIINMKINIQLNGECLKH
jgi:coenzyme F420 hydrogenase subunit beta